MKTYHFKTVVHNGVPIDFDLLAKGIFETGTPVLFIAECKFKGLLEFQKEIREFRTKGEKIDFIENLSKCKFADVKLIVKGEE